MGRLQLVGDVIILQFSTLLKSLLPFWDHFYYVIETGAHRV
jgi:hypothetical protein